MKKNHAKFLLQRFGASYAHVREFLLSRNRKVSRTTLSEIFNHGNWPKRGDAAQLKSDLEDYLRSLGACKEEIQTAWLNPPLRGARGVSSHNSSSPQPGPTPEEILLRRKTMIGPEIQKALGFSKDPFDNELESSDDVLATSSSQKALNKLLDAVKHQKFVALHGPVGSGKSTLKILLVQELKRRQNYLISEPVIIDKEKCRPSNIINAMFDDFQYAQSRSKAMKRVSPLKGDLEERTRWVNALFHLKVREGKKLVLIIDEAHGLRTDTLRALKRFHELQDGFQKLLSIILIGQEELVSLLSGNFELREVSARINLIEMKPIPKAVDDYLSHKIERAGGELAKIMDESALKTIKRLLPNALPLTLNNLTSKSIEHAFEVGHFPVTGEIVESAYRNIKNLAA